MLIILVKWGDSRFATGGWTRKEHVLELKTAPRFSVGVLLNETEKAITLFGDGSEGDYSRVITIPRGCILSMWQLKVKGGRPSHKIKSSSIATILAKIEGF